MSNLLILPEDGWKEVSTDSQGSFSLTNGGQHCIHAGQPPVDLIGHRYVGKLVDFTTGEGESVYVRVSRPCFAVGDVGVSTIPLSRNISSFSELGESWATMQQTIIATGDFEVNVDSSTLTVNSLMMMLGHTNDSTFIGFTNANARNTRVASQTTSGTEIVTDGEMRTFKVKRESGILTTYIGDELDGGLDNVTGDFLLSYIARYAFGAIYYGELKNIKIWIDGNSSTGSLVVDMPIDEDFFETDVILNLANESNNATVTNSGNIVTRGYSLIGDSWVSDGKTIPIYQPDENITPKHNVTVLGDSFATPEFLIALESAVNDDGVKYANDGAGGTSLSSQAIRFDATPERYDDTLIIMDGGLDEDAATSIIAIDSMVAHLTHDRWVYVQPSPGSYVTGTTLRNEWDANVALIVAHVGSGHYVECLTALQAGNDGSAQDLQDVADDRTPSSLRKLVDGVRDAIHENDAGDTIRTGVVGQFVIDSDWLTHYELPVAEANIDQDFKVSGDIVQLDGYALGDVDTILWTQISGDIVTLINPDTFNPIFVVPPSATQQTFTFNLYVANGANSSSDSVNITMLAD